MVQTDFYICGLAPFLIKANANANNQFLILCYEKPETEVTRNKKYANS